MKEIRKFVVLVLLLAPLVGEFIFSLEGNDSERLDELRKKIGPIKIVKEEFVLERWHRFGKEIAFKFYTVGGVNRDGYLKALTISVMRVGRWWKENGLIDLSGFEKLEYLNLSIPNYFFYSLHLRLKFPKSLTRFILTDIPDKLRDFLREEEEYLYRDSPILSRIPNSLTHFAIFGSNRDRPIKLREIDLSRFKKLQEVFISNCSTDLSSLKLPDSLSVLCLNNRFFKRHRILGLEKVDLSGLQKLEKQCPIIKFP